MSVLSSTVSTQVAAPTSPDEPLRALVYHGTTRSFAEFAERPPIASGSSTALLGTFFSASAQIAAHFTLKPDVMDEGYDVGSRSLIQDPWQFDSSPFQEGSRVAIVQLELRHPKVIAALAWMSWVEEIHGDFECEMRVAAWRQQLKKAGHDGLLIEAWDGVSKDTDGVYPSVETDATTYVLFDASQAQIQGWQEASVCWSASPAPRRPRPR